MKKAGITVTEAVVGMAVLAVVIPTMTRFYVSSRRLMQQTRHQSLVLDELTRHAETSLAAKTPEDLEPRLSPVLLRSIPTAKLSVTSEPDTADDSRRLTWMIRWGDADGKDDVRTLQRSLSVWLPGEQDGVAGDNSVKVNAGEEIDG